MAFVIRDVMEPGGDFGILENRFLIGTTFITQTKEQRNNIGKFYRKLDNSTTTFCLVAGGNDTELWKLINNPDADTTSDSDWELVPLSGAALVSVGDWDVNNTNPVLTDADAAGRNGEFYFATGAPSGITVQYPDLFRGEQKTIFDGDWIVSVGTYWSVVRPTTTWETLNRPQVIIDYENGIVIAHTHEISEINGLDTALSEKVDKQTDVLYSPSDFNSSDSTKVTAFSFLKQHYLKRFIIGDNKNESTYTAQEIDTLLQNAGGGGSGLFDWNRPINRLPVEGEIPEGTTTNEGLENIYYGRKLPKQSIDNISPLEIGTENQRPILIGEVIHEEVDVVTKIEILNEADGLEALPPLTPPVTQISELLQPVDPVENPTRKYRIRTYFKREAASAEEFLDSDPIDQVTVYPYLYGMEPVGLDGTTIYDALEKEVDIREDQVLKLDGSDERIYFAYPEEYGPLLAIVDQSGANVIENFTTNTITVDSSTVNPWSKLYRVYELNYDIALEDKEMIFRFETLVSPTLDQINEGSTNKHFTAPEKDKLAGLPGGGSLGDMKKSVYDPQDRDYVKWAEQLIALARNNTGQTIGEGSLVHFTQLLLPSGEVEIALADKDIDFEAGGFALDTIPAGGTGNVIRLGVRSGYNTSAYAVNDTVYLGSNGDLIFKDPPTSGLIQDVGIVARVGVTDGAVFFNPPRRNDLFTTLTDWQAHTIYDELSLIFFTGPTSYGIFRSTAAHTSTSNFAVDFQAGLWENVSGDMLGVFYDPTDKRVNVYNMDNMDDGTTKVAMTQAERDKLGALEPATYKGVFADPTELRTEYPSAQDGDNADVLSTGTTWYWDSNAPPNVSPPTTGGDWVDSLLAFGGDMQSSVYDPLNVVGDAFNMDNMAEGTNNKILSVAERTKLGGIEPLAEVNPTALETKTAYESNPDTNAFTDADETKLDNIEAGAQVNPADTDAVPEGATNLYYTEVRVSANADVSLNTSLRHTHSNKPTLDLITDAGSGNIITGAERSAIGTNTSKVSADGAVDTHSDVAGGATEGQILVRRSGVYTPEDQVAPAPFHAAGGLNGGSGTGDITNATLDSGAYNVETKGAGQIGIPASEFPASGSVRVTAIAHMYCKGNDDGDTFQLQIRKNGLSNPESQASGAVEKKEGELYMSTSYTFQFTSATDYLQMWVGGDAGQNMKLTITAIEG